MLPSPERVKRTVVNRLSRNLASGVLHRDMIGTSIKHFMSVRIAILTGLLSVITLIHYLMGGHGAGLLHSILGHLYIVPILMSAYWYGIKGGMSVSIISSVLFSPHLFLHWADPFVDVYNIVEIFLFLLLGGVTGILSQMERNQRFRYEQALVRLDESHRKLKEQTDILFQAEEQLRRADRLSALGELSASMAHEIRNPLGSIRGAAEILRDSCGEDKAKHEFIQILIKETERLNRIVQEILGFARPKQPEFQLIDLNQEIESVLNLVAQQAKKSGVTIERKLDPAIGRRDLDSSLLKQAFLNLVLNGIQAMPGGGTLTVESRIMHDIIEISISDTGVGISEEDKKKLFRPFFTTKQNGTGLGLAITYKIIENHRGTIDVTSRPGNGTMFRVKIPVTTNM